MAILRPRWRMSRIIIIAIIAIITYDTFRSRPLAEGPEGRFVKYWNPSAVKNENEPALVNIRLPCKGVRGQMLETSKDDRLNAVTLEETYPEPLMGAHDLVQMSETWMSAADRYGPYGLNENEESNARSSVDWAVVDWADLQNECIKVNAARFPEETNFDAQARLRYREDMPVDNGPAAGRDPREKPEHPRTAIVIRSWTGYAYTDEDMWSLRSIITETTLYSGGDYAVFLLVHVKEGDGEGIHRDPEVYRRVLEVHVPPEFRKIAVLFDESMLQSWYSLVPTHHPQWQIMQPFQIFAQFYTEYDYFWQLEMDDRFTGHVGAILDGLTSYSRDQPRKQSWERASYAYMRSRHGDFIVFGNAVNLAVKGMGTFGPVRIDDIEPIGPTPPTESALVEMFQWGAGEEADLISLFPCVRVNLMEDWWTFRNWTNGFVRGADTPRMACAPAQGRASWNLLNEVHKSQMKAGLAVPSEATLPSWAYWHGMKLIFAPQPYYADHERDPAEMEQFWNGGPIGTFDDGMGMGQGLYNAPSNLALTNTMTFGWSSHFPDQLVDAWLKDDVDGELPYLLRVHDGHVVMPNLVLHPRKTNRES